MTSIHAGSHQSISIMKYWEFFNYMSYHGSECTLILGDRLPYNLPKIEHIFKSYQHFFSTSIKFPKIRTVNKSIWEPLSNDTQNNFKVFKAWSWENWDKRDDIWPLKLPKVKNPKYISTSIVKTRDGKYFRHRDIPAEYVDELINILTLNNNVINLGDSRGFESAEELIDKIEIIRNSKFYIGSEVSWKDIAKIFGVYTIRILPGTTLPPLDNSISEEGVLEEEGRYD